MPPERNVSPEEPPDLQPGKEHSASGSRDVELQAAGMATEGVNESKVSDFKSLGLLDRFLAVWIFLAMAIGIILGNFVPNTGPALQKGKFVGVSVPIGKPSSPVIPHNTLAANIIVFFVAVGLLVMMYPILCKVRFETLHHVFRERKIWIQIGFSIIANWIVAPLVMVRTTSNHLSSYFANSSQLGLAWAFLPDKPGLRDGLILVGIARCIAMVLIWTGLAGGDSEYCAILVAVNSILQMVLFAPLAILFLQVISDHDTNISEVDNDKDISYDVVAKSVGVFLGIPLGAAIITRFVLRKLVSPSWYDKVFLKLVTPWSLIGLLFTILVLFASQGRQVVHQIVSVLRVAAPLVVYFGTIFFFTLLTTHKLGFGYKLAATQSFTAASNNFELAIAVAVAAYGPDSDQALASTVGPLIEVPVLLGLVYVVKAIGRRRGWKD